MKGQIKFDQSILDATAKTQIKMFTKRALNMKSGCDFSEMTNALTQTVLNLRTKIAAARASASSSALFYVIIHGFSPFLAAGLTLGCYGIFKRLAVGLGILIFLWFFLVFSALSKLRSYKSVLGESFDTTSISSWNSCTPSYYSLDSQTITNALNLASGELTFPSVVEWIMLIIYILIIGVFGLALFAYLKYDEFGDFFKNKEAYEHHDDNFVIVEEDNHELATGEFHLTE